MTKEETEKEWRAISEEKRGKFKEIYDFFREEVVDNLRNAELQSYKRDPYHGNGSIRQEQVPGELSLAIWSLENGYDAKAYHSLQRIYKELTWPGTRSHDVAAEALFALGKYGQIDSRE